MTNCDKKGVLRDHVTSDHTLWKMSRNASENVELGQLTTELKETYEDNHQEDDCEEEEKRREEEMSLLGMEDSQPCPPVQIVISGRHSSGPALIISNPDHQLHIGPPSSSPCADPDIQLARTDPDSCSTRDRVWAVTMPSRQQSSLQSVCGPKPAKVTTICFVLLSIWAMVVLIVHLEKKVSAVSSSLSSTEEKLRTMEDTASSYRLKTHQMLQKMQHKLSMILQAVETGVKPEMVKKTKKPNSVQADARHVPSSLPPDVTTHSTKPNDTKEEEGVEFFSDDW